MKNDSDGKRDRDIILASLGKDESPLKESPADYESPTKESSEKESPAGYESPTKESPAGVCATTVDGLSVDKKADATTVNSLSVDKTVDGLTCDSLSDKKAARIADFIKAAKKNAASIERIASQKDLPQTVQKTLRQRQLPPQVLCTPSLQNLDWQAAGIVCETRAPTGDDATGITLCPAADAQTGAMLFADNDRHALTISLLPPLHIVALPTKNIVANLQTLWKALPKENPPACLICGPSRTADIEQTFILGMHGPLAVHIILTED